MKSNDSMVSNPRLFRVILPVNDIDKAEEFYSFLLNMKGKRVSPGRHYFNCGGTILACYDPRRDTDNFDLPPNPEHLYFAVVDLKAIFAKAMEFGALITDQIGARPWGETSFYMKDPFGNKICFVQEETAFTGE